VNGTASTDGHTEADGSTITTPSDGRGVFVYRSSVGSGDVNFAGTRLRWNYGADGVNDEDIVDIKIFGIEMVYVPQGAFELGSPGGDEIDKFYAYPNQSNVYRVNSEAAIPIGTSNSNLYYQSNVSGGDQLGPVPAAFPKGYSAFYCMKYEVSQEQYVAFFNTLTDAQKITRDPTDEDNKNSDEEFIGNSISWESGNATTSSGARPVNYVNWGDVNAYLDWAGLRLMTELEYVKACRGTLPAVANEFAWGNSNIHTVNYTIVSDGTPNENISNPAEGIGNANYQSAATSKPLRCGIFASSAINKNREETGGSYYGIMELSGNVYERAITIGNSTGRSFTGAHGDGILTPDGDANVNNWTDPSTGEGGGYFGGSYPNGVQFLKIADRNDAANSFSGTNGRIGFRAVRTAP
jgi:formylglycine-generating enzyme required for sulfatase activity